MAYLNVFEVVLYRLVRDDFAPVERRLAALSVPVEAPDLAIELAGGFEGVGAHQRPRKGRERARARSSAGHDVSIVSVLCDPVVSERESCKLDWASCCASGI